MEMTNVCLNFKYGYCKYRNNCERTHFSEICETPKCSQYNCNKRHPRECFFFRTFGRCKFGTYCSYAHLVTVKENDDEKEVKELKSEILYLKEEVCDLKRKVEEIKSEINKVAETRTTKTEKTEDCSEVDKTLECDFESSKESNITEETEKVIETEIKSNQGDTENKTVETVEQNSQSLDDIIRENSGLYCEYCPWGPAKTKKGLITHKAKMHSSLYFSTSKNRK